MGLLAVLHHTFSIMSGSEPHMQTQTLACIILAEAEIHVILSRTSMAMTLSEQASRAFKTGGVLADSCVRILTEWAEVLLLRLLPDSIQEAWILVAASARAWMLPRSEGTEEAEAAAI